MTSYRQLDEELALAKQLKEMCFEAGVVLRKEQTTRENAGLTAERLLARRMLKAGVR